MNVVLRVTTGPSRGKEYAFRRHDTIVVGRSSQAQCPVEDSFLSRHHFLIEVNPPICFLRDLGSTNGTKVNGLRVDGVRLRDGDLVTAGESAFVISVEDTREDVSRIRCLGCGRPAPTDTVVAGTPGDSDLDWLCESCIDHRRRLPMAPAGYWIEKRLGGGGMGEIFLARQLESNRQVAIKMMIPTVAASERAKAYFRRELEVLKDLRHPNIVAFHDMVELEGQFLLIMEYVAGRNASEWTDALPGPLPVAAAARIGLQLLAALEHAHEKGYVHRDIKPSNLLVMGPPTRPTVKLSDFGLAKSFRDNAGFAGLTHQGDVGGSVGFLSPDHIRDFREVKEPADIYSAGATLYTLMAKTYPFLDFDPNRADAYMMILEHPSVPLRAHRPDVPEAFDAILRKSLEKQPRDRWKSAGAMARALRPFMDHPG